MKKKVLLILPPNVTVIPPFSMKKKKHAPLLIGFPLGLGYIAAYLLESDKYELRIIDANKDELSIPQILDIIKEFKPVYIGMTMYTVNSKVGVYLARAIKEYDKNIIVIAGGPHASYDYVNLLTKYPFFDFIVVGEGEVTTLELFSALDSKDLSKLPKIKGIAYIDTNITVHFTGERSLTKDIDIFPFPARKLVDFNAYIHKDNLLPYAIEIMGSRGCTHRCVFCSFQKMWRARKPEEIVREIKYLIEKYPQTKSFLFFDDNFSANRNRVIELCKMLISENLNKYMWSCLCRVDQIDEKVIYWMKKAGCKRILFGLETVDPVIMKNLNKKISPERAKAAVEMVVNNRIDALVFFIIGNPGETRETVKSSYNFAKKLKCQSTVWSIMQVYPGTILSKIQPCHDFVSYLYEPELDEPCGAISANIPAFENPSLDREEMKRLYALVFRNIVIYKAFRFPLFTFKKFLNTPFRAVRFLLGLLR